MNAATLRRGAAGAAIGLVIGYAAVRTRQAARDRRTPHPVLARPDPLQYSRLRRALMLAGIARSVAGSAAIAFVAADPLDRVLARIPRPLRAPSFALTVLAVETLRDLGVSYIEDHVLERTMA